MSHKTNRLPAFSATSHAHRRIDQRGIDPAVLEIVLMHGLDYPAGDGCLRRMILNSQLSDLVYQGFSQRLIEKALRIEAIVSPEELLITCYARTPQAMRRDSGRLPRSRQSDSGPRAYR